MDQQDYQPACRLYVLVAARAEVALVLRRGPSDWWRLLHWDLDKLILTPGAWFHGNLYARRCDISPDGRLFGYFALKTTARSGWPDAYFAVSRTPWLEALAAWKTGGTWTWGCQFSDDGDLTVHACIEEKPFFGAYPASLKIRPMSTDWPKRDVWNEAKRDWRFAEPDDPLVARVSAQPDLVMRREQPASGEGVLLGLVHKGVDFREPGIEGAQVEYFLQDAFGDVTPLADAFWAEWDHRGRLLMATRAGALEVFECRDARLNRVWSEDLRDQMPDPQPAPPWASCW